MQQSFVLLIQKNMSYLVVGILSSAQEMESRETWFCFEQPEQ